MPVRSEPHHWGGGSFSRRSSVVFVPTLRADLMQHYSEILMSTKRTINKLTDFQAQYDWFPSTMWLTSIQINKCMFYSIWCYINSFSKFPLRLYYRYKNLCKYSNYAASIHLANFLRLISSRFIGQFLKEPQIVNKSSLKKILMVSQIHNPP